MGHRVSLSPCLRQDHEVFSLGLSPTLSFQQPLMLQTNSPSAPDGALPNSFPGEASSFTRLWFPGRPQAKLSACDLIQSYPTQKPFPRGDGWKQLQAVDELCCCLRWWVTVGTKGRTEILEEKSERWGVRGSYGKHRCIRGDLKATRIPRAAGVWERPELPSDKPTAQHPATGDARDSMVPGLSGGLRPAITRPLANKVET